MLQLITNRSPSPAPLRGFPLPLWRGVNGIANNELITVSQTIVEQGLRAPSSNKKQGYLLPSPTGRGWGVGLPLSNGEGLGVGLLVSVPCSTGR